MLNPFIDLLGNVVYLYMMCVIVWAVVATLISFKVVNAYQPIVQRVMYALERIVEPALRPIRKFLPEMGGIDISPILLILLLNFAHNALYTYFYNF